MILLFQILPISLKAWNDLNPSVKKYEPKSALVGGIDGTEFINLYNKI